ncbi:FT-interacting protein 7-like [Zingiber officinale]|uniref:FT-interacting protein 7-like n=1 Tax=Zingiber officinale TaxID=94328 RepID=UPI001C4B4B89|nr:FT-interacting protein 7-like [Zingiber officinale]
MMSLWNGTQADELYSTAVHSDAALLPSAGIPHTRGQVYYNPRMSYLRVKVDSAQDLLTSRPDPEIFVKARLGPQVYDTRPSPVRSPNPTWKNEEIMLVASEPFHELLVLTVMDRAKNEALAQVVLGKGLIRTHADHRKPLPSQWFPLEKPGGGGGGGGGQYGKIQVACYYDNSYHVIDEAAHFTSDYQPSARPLRRATVGSLEIGILDAKDLAPQWSNNGSGKSDDATNAYCVAKYGPKWVRTRTILGTKQPWWNEQFSWEVHDPSTVLTVAVFNNSRVDGKNNNGNARDEPLGKIRIRLSTLDINRVYTHYYPLLAVHPTGVKKTGEIHMAVRFTYPSFWFSMLWLYTKPMYNKMHYLHPIPHHQMLFLRHYATQSVAAKLARAEPPLPREAVNYVFDDGSNRFSLRKGRANFMRIQALLADFVDFAKWFDGVRQWNRPLITVFVHVLFLMLVMVPRLLLPTAFLHLFAVGLWRFRRRPSSPAHADPNLWEWADPDIFDEELDNIPVLTRPPEVVARRYDRLRWLAGNLQEMVGHLANHAERLQALLNWRDPRATAMFAVFALAMAGVLWSVPFQLVVVIFGLYAMRHPKLRSKTPSLAFNFFRRLPGKADMLL